MELNVDLQEILIDKQKFKEWFIKTYLDQFDEFPYLSSSDLLKIRTRNEEDIEKYYIEISRHVSMYLYHSDYSGQIFEKSRKRELNMTRQITSYILFNKLKFSKSKIARTMKKNHATIIHHCRMVEDCLSVDKNFQKDFNEIELILKNIGLNNLINKK